MKILFPICLLLVYLCIACSEQKPEEQTEVAISADTTENRTAFASYSSKFQKIIKSEEGIIRGVNFGDALEDVITREDTIPLEDSTNFVSFTVALDDQEDEITDVFYYFDKQKRISGFRLDVYLDDKAAVDSLYREFTTYFTEKYGSPVIKEIKTIAWNSADNTKIVMKDVGIKESPGLQLQIARPK
ncbi:hypothetical protein Q0590_01070 [Rhodocytophaga aerolata]|uniref:Lipoprotein n=1 Tax=Rhodocytophaga aerolata TaxID=455078 RepID=A0ABT8QY98_9BACT|nr:hypothetical protein [Rhodocytophaga aerolata]MDO1444816.1 hypothetical protein [Rhodocytophaga aerolata]